MDFKEIQELIKLINKSNLTEFKMQDGDFKLSVRTKKYGRSKNLPPQQIVSVPAAPMQQVQAPFISVPGTPPPAPVVADDASSDTQGVQDAANAEGDYIEVRSPIVGTFYRAPSPDKPPYIKIGDSIEVGTVVCIVEAMKLFNEIESEVAGKVVKIVTEDASPVEYDQVLYLVDPKG